MSSVINVPDTVVAVLIVVAAHYARRSPPDSGLPPPADISPGSEARSDSWHSRGERSGQQLAATAAASSGGGPGGPPARGAMLPPAARTDSLPESVPATAPGDHPPSPAPAEAASAAQAATVLRPEPVTRAARLPPPVPHSAAAASKDGTAGQGLPIEDSPEAAAARKLLGAPQWGAMRATIRSQAAQLQQDVQEMHQ